jgi:outer membrane biosynthesis protein TonB
MTTDVECSDPEIIKAFREVQNEKSSTTWAVFGYVPKTNKLKLDSTGTGDIDELREELSDGKVQYAAYRVMDEKSGLGKVVFINWVGEGVPESRKGITSAHVTKIAQLLKGFHVQVNARNENDLESKALKEKVTKAAGAFYTAHKEGKEGQSKSVGGDATQMQSQTQKDSSVKADTAGIKQKFQNIKAANEQAPAPKPVPKPIGKVAPPVQQEAAAPPKPVMAPKPIAKVNTFQPPEPPKPKFTPKPPEPEPEPEPQPEEQYQQPEEEYQKPIEPEPEAQPEEQLEAPKVQSGGEIYSARALYDFDAQDETELEFKEGDIIKVISQIDDAWYEGERDGKVGMFPVEYVEILN